MNTQNEIDPETNPHSPASAKPLFYDDAAKPFLKEAQIEVLDIRVADALERMCAQLEQIWAPDPDPTGKPAPTCPSATNLALKLAGYLRQKTCPSYESVIGAFLNEWRIVGLSEGVVRCLAKNSKKSNLANCYPGDAWVQSWIVETRDLSQGVNADKITMTFLRSLRLAIELMRLQDAGWKCPILGIEVDKTNVAPKTKKGESIVWPKGVSRDRLIEVDHCIPHAARMMGRRYDKSCSPYRLISGAANSILGSIPWSIKSYMYDSVSTCVSLKASDLSLKAHYEMLQAIGDDTSL